MRLLLHICCAPCSVMCIETLRAEGIEPTGFWYNPNIHPVTEYKARKNTLTKYAADIHLRLIVKNEYGLRNFIDHVYPHYESRCGYCYLLSFGRNSPLCGGKTAMTAFQQRCSSVPIRTMN